MRGFCRANNLSRSALSKVIDGCVKSYKGWTRIKSRKQKRWIGYCANRNQTFPHPQDTKELAVEYAMRHYTYDESEWQFVEIEFEV